jgi:hypothetical protein
MSLNQRLETNHKTRRSDYTDLFFNGIFMAVILFVSFLIPTGNIAAQMKSEMDFPCDLHRGPCTQPLSGGMGTVTLEVSPKPVTAMSDLIFTVRITDISLPDMPYIDLGMPGMKMGPNRVSLKSEANGTFTGSGTIVRCPSGKTLWQITVTVPGAGTAEFRVNAVY